MEDNVIPFPKTYKECAHITSRGATKDEQTQGIDWVCEDCGEPDPHRGDLL